MICVSRSLNFCLALTLFTSSLSFNAFPARLPKRSAPLAMVKSDTPLEIIGRDIEVTPALRERVEDKVGKVVSRLGQDINAAHVRLRVHRNPSNEVHSLATKPESQISEVTVSMKGGSTIRATERTDNMYASIDLMSHRLAQKLKKHYEKIHPKTKSKLVDGVMEGELEEPVFDEETLLVELDNKYKDQAKAPDPLAVDMSVVKPKSFPMPPISVEEAVLCLYYIDHPFYVFRNKDTNEINVVYKRDVGGVGHIKPE
eukprot:CAMPEP_0182427740 /NCGR_PEP_ID=MMETSP1167-20130531/19070_1 /TAXON_ID=2988 /ORGANISM="Mallomonas Sp, Strain CCMP3275" /LENGTH=256 /DNA_ID=CAMNT_0024610183 /DNA_START=63 /DNA_END=833 /DNA_ORIENTATION=+